jgi:hypothetical protein
VILAALGDRDLADARVHRHRHMSRIFAEEIQRNRAALTYDQIADLTGRVARHDALADELQQAVAVFDQVRA